MVFRRVAAPSREELEVLVQRLGLRIGRALERRGVLVREEERSYLELEPKGEPGLADLLGHSITYRIAVGPRAGQKVLTLQTVAPRDEERREVASAFGFSLHGGVGVAATERQRLEHLCRYVTRPAVASGRWR